MKGESIKIMTSPLPSSSDIASPVQHLKVLDSVQPGPSSEYAHSPSEGTLAQVASPVKVVLLIGEAGAGKSTFLCYMANYFLGGSLNSLKALIPNRLYRTTNGAGFEGNRLDDMEVRQTRNCFTYSILRENVEFCFIDTPGLSNTSNSYTQLVDSQSIDTILTAACQAGQLHAVVLVVNGSMSRLSATICNALQRITENYPDVLPNNLIVTFTNCSGSSENFDQESLPFPPKKICVLNHTNYCPFLDGGTEESLEQKELRWTQSMGKMKEILELIDVLTPQRTQIFPQILESGNAVNSPELLALEDIPKQTIIINIPTQPKIQESTIIPELIQENIETKNVCPDKLKLEEVKAEAHDSAFQHPQYQQLYPDSADTDSYTVSKAEKVQLPDSVSSKSVLVMGETGAGKSTFINYVANFFLGTNMDSIKVMIPNKIIKTTVDKDFVDYGEINPDDLADSQRSTCTTYCFRKDKVE